MSASTHRTAKDPSANDLAAQCALQAAQLLQQALMLLGVESHPAHAEFRWPDRLLKLPEVERLTGLCRSTIYEHMQKGTFPRSVKVGRRAATWSESAVQTWIADRVEGRTLGQTIRRTARPADVNLQHSQVPENLGHR